MIIKTFTFFFIPYAPNAAQGVYSFCYHQREAVYLDFKGFSVYTCTMYSPSSSWIIKGRVDENALAGMKFSPVFRSLMHLRGFSNEHDVLRFINPNLGDLRDPRSMRGIEPAVTRLSDAIANEEPIGVFTDYDVDGVCSAALLHRFLLNIGAPEPMIFIPDRHQDGYGLNKRGIDTFAEKGVRLLITADCGITSAHEVEYAHSLGMDVIVTDHHEPEGDLPEALAVINPKQPGCNFQDEDLCGAGVVFHLIVALRSFLRECGFTDLPNLKEELDLVAMATVADVVSLGGINRILVKEGLNVINAGGRVGIAALSKVSGINRALFAHDLGFVLGPRINAAGRVANARKALDLLTTDDEDRAWDIAGELHAMNRLRQAKEQKVLREAMAMLNAQEDIPPVIVVAGLDWHMGVIGIVASRLADRYSRPALVISIVDGVGKGSGRSREGIDLHEALSSCSHLLRRFGGHKMAVGFSVTAENILSFKEKLENIIANTRPEQNPFEVDLEISADDITPDFIQELNMLSPFGDGNPEPVFKLSGMEVLSTKKLDSSKTKLVLKQSGRVFHTLGVNLKSQLSPGNYVDVAFTPVMRHINGYSYLYLSLKAFSPV